MREDQNHPLPWPAQRWLLVGLCTGLWACVSRDSRNDLSLPDRYPAPMTVEVNTGNGYRMNAFFPSDTVTPVLNAYGDTVITGQWKPIKGFLFPEKQVSPVSIVPAKSPILHQGSKRVFVLSPGTGPVKVTERMVYPVLKDQPRAKDSFSINSYGDSLPTGKICTVFPQKRRFQFPAPVKALPMTIRPEAHNNISLLNADQELLSSNISCLAPGRDGYFWIGLNNGGLCRYDGNTFLNFTRESGLTNNYVLAILEDKKGRLWIGTNGGGLNLFDGTALYAFTEENGLTSNFINSLAEDLEGNVWIGTRDAGLTRISFPAPGNQALLLHVTSREGLPDDKITALLTDQRGYIWIGSAQAGVTRYQPGSGGKNGRMFCLTQQNGLPDNRINFLSQTLQGNIWIACSTGVCSYELPQGNFSGKLIRQAFPKFSRPIYVKRILEDHEGNVWFGTLGMGVFQFVPGGDNGNLSGYMVQYDRPEGLPHNDIMALAEDQYGDIWVGTKGNGVACINRRSVRHYGQVEGFTDYQVNSVFEDDEGVVWLGTAGDGLYRCPSGPVENGNVTMQYTKECGLPSNFITSVTGDSHGNIWVGTSDAGFARFDGHDFIVYEYLPEAASAEIRKILIGEDDKVWIATHNAGLFCLQGALANHDETYQVVRFSEKEGVIDNNVRDVFEDRRQQIWLATGLGVSRMQINQDAMTGTVFQYSTKEGLPAPYTNAIREDRKGNIWIGTGAGLVRLRNEKEAGTEMLTYIGYRRKSFMNTIRSVLEDAEGNIWFGSEAGIHKIVSDSSHVDPYIPVKFYTPDGFKGSNFLNLSGCLDQHGGIWWNHQNGGVDYIDLGNFKESWTVTQPKITALSINDRMIDFRSAPDSLLAGMRFDSVPIFENYPEHPDLPYTQNSLAFYFTAFNWMTPQKIRYSFRIKGLNEAWSRPSAEASASFRSLPYGSFVLEVRAKGETGQWTEPLSYAFRVRPPWWLSGWAYMIYGLIGCALIYFMYGYQLSRKLAIADRKRLTELDVFKNRMYSNLSHEFRTPLTLIHGPVSQAIQNHTTLGEKDLQSMYRQSSRLQELINQMLDLQKLESGKMMVNEEYGEILQLLRFLLQSFETWADEKSVALSFVTTVPEVFMDFDREKVTQIITNLVSNAIKYSPKNGKVTMQIDLSPTGDALLIRVMDTGEGIRPEDRPYIFDRFYQSPKAASGGTGIGLALTKSLVEVLGGRLEIESTSPAGTVFLVTLRITRRAAVDALDMTGPQISNPVSFDHDFETNLAEEGADSRPVILAIEDNTEIAQFISRCLSPEYQVLLAFNGNDGLSMAIEHVPDLIISDIRMPGKNGYELTGLLKSTVLTSHIPVILLTGLGDHEALMKGIGEGADVFLTKPFDPPELQLRIRKLLDLRASLREYYRGVSKADTQSNEAAPSSSLENEFLKKMRLIIEEHLSDAQFNMQLLCRQMAMSHPQLHRKVTALTGESVGKFVRQVRLHKAIQLLQNSDLTISEIAYETGFSEPGYFGKIFAKEYHMSPGKFRNRP